MESVVGTIFVGVIMFSIITGIILAEHVGTVTALTEKHVEQNHVSVMMEQKQKISLLEIKNIDATPISEVKIKAIDSGIKFIKAKGWERERIDPSTVIIQTNDSPLELGRTMMVLLLLTNPSSSYEWIVFDENSNEIAKGIIGNENGASESRLDKLKFVIKEYPLPDPASFPLFPLYDKTRNVIWISDLTSPRTWKFDLQTKEFEFLQHDGESTVRLATDSKDRVWFTDSKAMTFGYVDPDSNISKIFSPPLEGFVIDLKFDSNDNLWLAMPYEDKIIRVDSNNESFKIFESKKGSQPGAILIDRAERVWFTQIGSGTINVIDSVSGKITEYQPPDGKLVAPTSMMLDTDGNIWIGEHEGTTITKFDPQSLNFKRYNVPDKDALTLGIVEDKYGNIWYAEHVTDDLAVLDPKTGLTKLIQISTSEPLTQWLTIDKEGIIWFTEPNNAKIGSVSVIMTQ